MEKIEIKLADDHIRRVSQCSPEDAIFEMIWNSIDAGATNIRVSINRNKLGGIDTIEIEDNGTGIEKASLGKTFGRLGESTKKSDQFNPRGKPYHGKNWRGQV